MNQKGFANIVLVIVIVILAGVVGYFTLVKKSEPVIPQPTPTQTPPAGNTLSANLINALNQKNYTGIENLLPEKINFAIEATECCGDINRTDAISKIRQLMEKTNFDFSQDQAAVKQIKDYFSKYGPASCSNGVIGIGSDKSVLTFCISQNKVDAIRTTSNYREYGIADETANWKIYRNSKYGFEMKYPNDWLIEGNQDNVYFKRTDISQEEMEGKQIGYPLSILIENTSAESILDWFENEFSSRLQGSKPEKHLMTIGGVNGIKYSEPISMGGCEKTFAMIKNGKLFRFLRHGSTCNYSDELFANIISTFKFVK